MTVATAVVGGGVGAEHHLAGLQECPNTELVAICDCDETRASERATEYDISGYADFEGLLARESLDWIHLCTPVGAHIELARMAIEDGIPVLIAEPVTETVAEAEELERLVEAYDATVSVGHAQNFSPTIRNARRRIESGTIGTVRSVDLLYAGEFGEAAPVPIYVLLNLGGYPSSPESVQANTAHSEESAQKSASDSVQFQYTTDDGVLCSATVLESDRPHKTVHVHGDRGSIEIDIVSQSVTVVDRDGQTPVNAPGLRKVGHVLGRVRAAAENVATAVRHNRDTVADLDAHSYQFFEEARAIQRDQSPAVPVAEGTWTRRMVAIIRASATDPDGGQTVPLHTSSSN